VGPLTIFPVKGERPGDPDSTHWHVQLLSPRGTGLTATSAVEVNQPASAVVIAASGRLVSAEVTFAQTAGRFKYFYVLSNNVSANPLTGFSVNFEQEVFSQTHPVGWIGSLLGATQGWSWGAIAGTSEIDNSAAIPLSTAAIQPGMTVSGFSFESSMPPTIRPFSVRPFSPVPVLDSEEELETTLPEVRPPLLGQTIAPRSASNLNPAEHIVDIQQLIEQAFGLGWIDNSGILLSLTKELDAAKNALLTGSVKEAANILTAFMRDAVQCCAVWTFRGLCNGKVHYCSARSTP